MASSRVGASTRPVTSVPSGSVCSTMGMPKAKVLPDPVGALAMTCLPVLEAGDGPGLHGGGQGKALLVQCLQNALGEVHFTVSQVDIDLNAIDFHKTILCPPGKGRRVSFKYFEFKGIIYHNRRQVARGEGRSFKGELPAGGLGQRRAPRGGRLRGAEGVGIRGPPAVLPGA